MSGSTSYLAQGRFESYLAQSYPARPTWLSHTLHEIGRCRVWSDSIKISQTLFGLRRGV